MVLGLVVAYTLLYWVPLSPLPEVMPWGVITQGVIFGTSYALLAMGLILIYRTTRIVNFAYGAMGAHARHAHRRPVHGAGLELLARHRGRAWSSAPSPARSSTSS